MGFPHMFLPNNRRFAVPPSRHVPPHRCTAAPPRRRAATLRACVARAMLMAALPSIMFRQGCHHQSFGTTHGESSQRTPSCERAIPEGPQLAISKAVGGICPAKEMPRGATKTKRSFILSVVLGPGFVNLVLWFFRLFALPKPDRPASISRKLFCCNRKAMADFLSISNQPLCQNTGQLRLSPSRHP